MNALLQEIEPDEEEILAKGNGTVAKEGTEEGGEATVTVSSAKALKILPPMIVVMKSGSDDDGKNARVRRNERRITNEKRKAKKTLCPL